MTKAYQGQDHGQPEGADMKILIVKLGAMGDVINTLPAVIRLKNHFHAKIHWLVAPLSLPLIMDHPAVDNTIIFDRHEKNSLFKTLSTLRQQYFDLTIDFQRTLKSGFFCMAARSKQRLGFDKARCKEFTWMLPFTRIAPDDPGKHMLDQYLDFCDHLNIAWSPVEWGITGHPFSRLPMPRDYVVLNIGATKKANLWNPENFALLADMIHGKNRYDVGDHRRPRGCGPGKGSGSPYPDKTSEPDRKNQPPGVDGHSVPGPPPPPPPPPRGVVSCDTGPMHLAVALGIPTLGLFGPSNPRRTGPYGGEVILSGMDCSPCNRRECPNPECMALIHPARVYEKFIHMIRPHSKTRA